MQILDLFGSIIDIGGSLFGGKKKGPISDMLKMKKDASKFMKDNEKTLDQAASKIPGKRDDELLKQAKNILK